MLIGIDGNEANVPNRVGVNQYAFDLLHALHQLPSPHHFVIYLKNPPLSDMPHIAANWQYRVIPFPKLWTQTRLPWDLYTHSPRPNVFFTPSHYAPRWSPVPTVISIMDLGYLTARDQFTAKDYNQLVSWTRYSINNASKIIAISEFTKTDILKNYSLNPDDIKVTYPAHDSTKFFPRKDLNSLKKYGIKTPYILFLSSLKPSKNIEGLLRAFKNLKPKTHNLVIAGKKAWLFDQIFQLVKDLNLDNQVVFTGFVDEADKPALMTQAAAFVLPSFHEGFGIPVLEAMACGSPVVVSQVASLPEVAGPAGIYVDPFSVDSITHGLSVAISKSRPRYVELGYAQVKKFSWKKTAALTLQVLESLKVVK